MRRLTSFVALAALLVVGVTAASSQARETRSPDYVPTDRERARWTMADLRTLAIAIEAYHIDKGKYPDGATLEDVLVFIEPHYVRKAPVQDAWGTTFKYSVSLDQASYIVVSAGADTRFNDTTWSKPGEFQAFGEDVVLKDGRLTRTWAYR